MNNEVTNIVIAGATVALAVFTYLVWRIHVSQHRHVHFGLLKVVLSKARFDGATQAVRLEVLLINTSAAPAVIQKWEALVKDGNFQQSMADGRKGKTQLIKAPAYVGGPGWVVERGSPAALSLRKKLAQNLGERARIDVEISYAGGQAPVTVIKTSVPVEIT